MIVSRCKNKMQEYLFYLLVFVLPWQTRWIARDYYVGGGSFEYGRVSLYVFDIILIFLLFFCLAVWKKKLVVSDEKHAMNSGRIVFGGLLLLCVYALVTVFWANEKIVSVYWAARLILGVGLFWATQNINFSKVRLAIVVVAAGFVQGWLAVWQFISQETTANKWLGMASQKAQDLGASVVGAGEERWLRAYGSWPHPNILGGFLIAVFVFWLYLLARVKNKYQKRFILITGFFITAGIFFTFSRGAWLVFVVLYLLSWVYILKNKVGLLGKKFLTGAGMLMIILIIFFWPLTSTRILGGENERLEIKSNIERLNSYRQAGEIIKNNIMGVGLGNYTFVVKDFYKINNVWEIQPAHNVYLLIAAELGIVGVIIVAAIILTLVQALYKKKKYFYLVFLFVGLFLGLFDHYWWTLPAGLYGVFLGLALLRREIK